VLNARRLLEVMRRRNLTQSRTQIHILIIQGDASMDASDLWGALAAIEPSERSFDQRHATRMNSLVSISEDRKPRSRYCGSEQCGAPLASTVTRETQSALSRDLHSHAQITSPFHSGRCYCCTERLACRSFHCGLRVAAFVDNEGNWWIIAPAGVAIPFLAVCPSIADGSSKPRIPHVGLYIDVCLWT